MRTVEQPLGTGERYSVSDVAIGLGYGRRITDRFSAGLRVNYVQETIWHTSLHAVVLDIGTLYQVSERGLRIGASLSNFGTQGRFGGRDLAIVYDADPTRATATTARCRPTPTPTPSPCRCCSAWGWACRSGWSRAGRASRWPWTPSTRATTPRG